VGAAGPDLLDDAWVIFRPEVTVAEAGDLESGVLGPDALYQRPDHLGPCP
jgi:hypothetical protein